MRVEVKLAKLHNTLSLFSARLTNDAVSAFLCQSQCKTQAMEIMRSLGDKLAMVERTVPSNPPALPGSKKDNSRELQNAMIGFLGAADNAQVCLD